MKPNTNRVLFDALPPGHVDSPASDTDHASDRWHRLAELCAARTWNPTAGIPEYPRLVADRTTAIYWTTAMHAATAEQRQVIREVATAGPATGRHQSPYLAWSAALDTCTDARSHLDGIDFSGLEAILGAVDAILHQHEASIALAFLNNGFTTWEHRLASHGQGAA